MQQKPRNIQPRHARIERIEDSEVNAEESHLWAISYSDLLMVLMSFFIIFFSTEETKRKTMLEEIAVALNPDAALNAKDGTVGGKEVRTGMKNTDGENGLAAKGQSIQQVAAIITTALKNSEVSLSEIKDASIHVQFERNTFHPRQYKLSQKLKNDIGLLMRTTQPFADRIRLTFIGHSDSSRLAKKQDTIITDNYVLSALRANEAMQYAAALGAPRESLYLQGSASNTLDSRTISVRIEQR